MRAFATCGCVNPPTVKAVLGIEKFASPDTVLKEGYIPLWKVNYEYVQCIYLPVARFHDLALYSDKKELKS